MRRIVCLLFMAALAGAAEHDAALAKLAAAGTVPAEALAAAVAKLGRQVACPAVVKVPGLTLVVDAVPAEGGDARIRAARVAQARWEALRTAQRTYAWESLRGRLAATLDSSVKDRAFLDMPALVEVLLAHRRGAWVDGQQAGPGIGMAVGDAGERIAVAVWVADAAALAGALPPLAELRTAYADAQVSRAKALAADGDGNAALGSLGQAIVHGRNEAAIQLLSAELLHQTKRTAVATQVALKIWQEQRAQLDAVMAERLGDLLAALGKAPEAAAALQLALELKAQEGPR